ncbi:carbohydrate ABC transporter substrate-binding protein [Stappia sp. F7233]|uniref:Probable sugar-binding periplasmic protein n=1 Tax=Stappia albiluteola TaxID=2758565 RepID=A0A839ABQ0_9HYPH|nr:ABC transporter substrate-binding protein [Stappia albiluteola]MBA5777120.1 carbohydrate ABC transporter substrate-binding protein [Stappia albiluteola]
MHSIRKILLATAFACTAPAFAATASAEELKAEVLHWWTSGGESAAVKVFADGFTDAGGEWIDTAIAGGQNARTAGINRIVGGNPPTAMQFNTGKQFDELVANGFLRSVEDVAAANNWRDALPPAIVKATNRDGQFYAVPVNIHGQNWLWYNTDVFSKAGLQPPKTFQDMIAAGPKLRESGFIPLAHGGQNWQDHLLFDAIVVAEAGQEIFAKVYGEVDTDAAKSPEFLKAVETFAALRGMTDEGSPGRNWNDATALVITGKAAMQLMGDWAKGEFIAAGLTPDKEYGCTVMPGGYVMGGDVFVFPKIDDAAQKTAQEKLAGLMLSPETQIAFNLKKGSVPVRLDIDVSAMDACAQTGVQTLKDPNNQVASINYIASPDLVGATRDVITQFWSTPSMTPEEFVEKFVSAMDSAS